MSLGFIPPYPLPSPKLRHFHNARRGLPVNILSQNRILKKLHENNVIYDTRPVVYSCKICNVMHRL